MIFKGYSHFPNIIAPTGATGPTGPSGATGATGPTGPTGPSATAAAFVANATGTNDIVNKFNSLLANLQAAGLMKSGS